MSNYPLKRKKASRKRTRAGIIRLQIDMVALALPFAIYLITSLVGYKIIMREKRVILLAIDEKIQGAIDQLGEALQNVFEKPIVKASMTNLGKMGGAAMQDKAIGNQMATDILNSPKFEGLKMAVKMGLNVDIDQYIEEHGAARTLQQAVGLGDRLGIDVMELIAGGLDGANLSVGSEANGIDYYLRR